MLARVAEDLFWMSRYVERAVAIARLVDVTLHLELDAGDPDEENADLWAPLLSPALARWGMHAYFGGWLVAWFLVPGTRLPRMDAPPLLLLVAAIALLAEALLLVPLLAVSSRWSVVSGQ